MAPSGLYARLCHAFLVCFEMHAKSAQWCLLGFLLMWSLILLSLACDVHLGPKFGEGGGVRKVFC